MPKPRTSTGEKNLISKRLIRLREQHHMSQRLLAYQLQLNGYDMDKNVITRIETNKRYVTDVELKVLAEIFHVSYDYLIDGKEADFRGRAAGKSLGIQLGKSEGIQLAKKVFHLASHGESCESIAEICGITAENVKEILE